MAWRQGQHHIPAPIGFSDVASLVGALDERFADHNPGFGPRTCVHHSIDTSNDLYVVCDPLVRVVKLIMVAPDVGARASDRVSAARLVEATRSAYCPDVLVLPVRRTAPRTRSRCIGHI